MNVSCSLAKRAPPICVPDVITTCESGCNQTCSNGTTPIDRVYHIDRWCEKIEQKPAAVGADIERVKESKTVVPMAVVG